ncbi:His-Xaa-Ser system protein HxsD [Niastella populi]|uniref:His-Xaa-Ser system protein HxsD n=1 Tax=Niastella populi TaxID=550983 RepID=A0A1V9F0X2_9BACT|nr:His-Xaa-Ser system protein HxsD [Niastella populi]OQP51906.1 His-Xaa-Ser system protein HxsD [Niastella populi]
MNYDLNNGSLIIKVDKNIYSEDVLYKCLYWYTNKYTVFIETKDDHYYSVSIKLANDLSVNEETAKQLNEQILRDLIDFKLRDIITKETQTVRELIVAKAFANFQIDPQYDFDISDPVGFNPDNV